MRGDTLRNMFVLVEYEQSVEVDELIRGRECDSVRERGREVVLYCKN